MNCKKCKFWGDLNNTKSCASPVKKFRQTIKNNSIQNAEKCTFAKTYYQAFLLLWTEYENLKRESEDRGKK